MLLVGFGTAFAQQNLYDITAQNGTYVAGPGITAPKLVSTVPGWQSGVTSYAWWGSNEPVNGFVALGISTPDLDIALLGTATNTRFYRRTAVKNGVTYTSNVVKVEKVNSSYEDQHYVLVNMVMVPGITTPAAVDNLAPVTEKLQSKTYYDGLGRIVQQTGISMSLVSGTNTYNDMVGFSQYDQFGREVRQYLPYPTAEQPGKYKPDAEVKQGSYYTTNFQDGKPFAATQYDGSPLNRATKAFKPGNDWHNSTGLQGQLLLNTATDDVQKYVVGPGETDMPVKMGVYTANTLLKNISTDELGKQVIEYVNGLGQLVLKKVQLTAANDVGTGSSHVGWMCTYYVYDDFGNLRVEVSPEAVEWLRSNAWSFASGTGATVFSNLCFVYAYDEKGRMVYKKSPDVAALYMLYDARDRMVMMQDGNQRAKSPQEWTLNLYDDLDRLKYVVLFRTTLTRLDLKYEIIGSDQINPGHLSPIDLYTFNDPSVCTIIKELYYDNYQPDNFAALPFSTQEAANTQAIASPAHALAVQATGRTLGMLTGTRVRVLGSTTNLLTTHYYDEDGSGIQTIETNIKGGTDTYTSRLHWDGRLLASRELRNIPGGGVSNFAIETRYGFDALRRVTHTYKKWGGSAEKLVATVQYDAFGRLGNKRLSPDFSGHFAGIGPVGGGLEALQYSYNIQGSLVGINRQFALKEAGYNKWGNFFGLYLGYTGDPAGLFSNAARLNGQLRGVVWNTQGDDAQRRYEYTYDNAGRLTAANFANKPIPTAAWSASALNFSTTHLAYTLNGNLTALRNMGAQLGSNTPVLIDQLAYTYSASGRSNRLLKVVDNTTATTVNGTQGDFVKGPLGNTTADYTYDANGNMITDRNKGMVDAAGAGTAGILYNHLDKPVEVNRTGKGRVKFTYDANGSRLKREFISVDATQGTKVTWYFGSLELEEVVGGNAPKLLELKNIYFEEGRIRVITPQAASNAFDALSLAGNITLPGGKQGSIDYYLSDHRSDVRMILTEETQWSYTTASMETASGRDQVELGLYGSAVQATRVAKSTVPAWQANTSTQVSRLSKNTQVVGPGQLLKVMAGDQVSSTVQYYYASPVSNPAGSQLTSSVVSALSTLIGLSGSTGALAKAAAPQIAANAGSNSAFASLLTTNASSTAPNQPKAYLNIIFFDERFIFVPESSQQLRVQTAGNGVAPLVLSNIRVPKNGYVWVFISNESDAPVYFDNLQVRHDRGRILEENHYYAYGLKIAALSSRAFGGAPNNYQYQGDYSEFDDDLGWNEFQLRSYDPQLGRFLQWDPYDQYASGYVGMGNDPVNMVDPTGGWGEKIWELTSQAVMTGSSGGVVVAPTAAQKAASAARKAAKIAEAAKNTKKLVNTALAVADVVTDALPFVGSTKDIYRGARDGDWLQLGLGIVGLAADVFTLGGASVAKGAVKIGVKAALKSSTKKAVKETVEEGGQKLVNKTTRKLPCGCFVAGTLILTSSGQKPIEAIDVGDMVWAYNDTTGTYDQKRVKTLFSYERDSVYYIKIGNDVIKATSDHPFYIGGRWLRVAELKVGDSVKLFDGSNLVIEQITVVPGRTTVYNFEVEDYHTYYVSGAKVLVHNSGPCPFKTVVEDKSFTKDLEKAYGKQAVEEFERNIKTRLSKGEPGGKVHDLTGDLKGWKAVDIPGTGQGRGGGRIIFREVGEQIEIRGFIKGHDYTKILGGN